MRLIKCKTAAFDNCAQRPLMQHYTMLTEWNVTVKHKLEHSMWGNYSRVPRHVSAYLVNKVMQTSIKSESQNYVHVTALVSPKFIHFILRAPCVGSVDLFRFRSPPHRHCSGLLVLQFLLPLTSVWSHCSSEIV